MRKKTTFLCLSFMAVVSISFSNTKYDIRNFIKSMNIHKIEQLNNNRNIYSFPHEVNKSYVKKLDKVVQSNIELEEGYFFDAISTLEYNNFDQISSMKTEIKLSGTDEIFDEYSVIYHHNNKGLVDKYQSYFSGEFSDQAEFEYNSNRQLITEMYYHVNEDSQELQQYSQTDYTYNNDNLLIEKVVSYFMYPNTKLISYKEKYEYNSNKQLIKISEYAEGLDQNFTKYTAFVYNEQNKLIEATEFQPIIMVGNEKWIPTKQNKIQYDNKGNATAEEVFILDEETDDMILSSLTEWNYDLSTKWSDVLYPIVPDNDSPIADENTNMIEEEVLFEYNSEGTIDTLKAEFIYTDYNSIKENSVLEASVFPNPTSDFITISNTTGLVNGKIVVYNLDGEIIFTKTYTDNQTFDFSNVAKGTYFYKILNSDEVKYSGKFKVD